MTVIAHGFIALFFLVLIPETRAEITKEITIHSSPAGADVSQLEGSKKNAIGKTPVKYQASFHSEKSLLRFEISSPGFEKQIIKVTANEEKKYVRLKESSDIANDEDIKDKTASALQKKSEEAIKSVLSSYRSKNGLQSLRFYEKIRFVAQSNNYFLKVPIALGNVALSNELAKSLWMKLYAPFIYPLSKALNNQVGPTWIQINAISSQEDINLSPQTRVETSVVMECVGGMVSRYAYSSCASYSTRCINGNCTSVCQPGTTLQSAWDPCASREPTTYTNSVIDVGASPGHDRGFILFEINTKDILKINNPETLYQMIKLQVVQN